MNEHSQYPDAHHNVESNTVFGFWIYLMTDFVLFATLFATYAVLKNGTFGGPSSKELFQLSPVLIETLCLLGSSYCCAMAALTIEKNRKDLLVIWYSATFLFGLLFLVLMGNEFSNLIEAGHTWKKSAFLSAYFTLVGTHGLHIFFGLLFTPIFIFDVLRRGFIPVTIRRLTCLKIFWLFSYIVWIFMFTFIYLTGAL